MSWVDLSLNLSLPFDDPPQQAGSPSVAARHRAVPKSAALWAGGAAPAPSLQVWPEALPRPSGVVPMHTLPLDLVPGGGAGGAGDAEGASPVVSPAPPARSVPDPAAAGAEAGLGPGPAAFLSELLSAPEGLHPSLWRADQLGGGRQATTPSGFATLDAELPGGGWPHRLLTELLLPHDGVGEMRLLAPALARLQAVGASAAGASGSAGGLGGRCVMLFDPPAAVYASALAQLGLDARQWLVVRSRTPHGRPAEAAPRAGLSRLLPGADVLWALEQALRSGHVGAVLAWLPAPVKADALRRLQLAAQAHDGPALLLRPAGEQRRPSVAPLRLLLQPAGADALQVQLLKRRGPPLAQALRLSLPPVLCEQPQERAHVQQAAQLQVQVHQASRDWARAVQAMRRGAPALPLADPSAAVPVDARASSAAAPNAA